MAGRRRFLSGVALGLWAELVAAARWARERELWAALALGLTLWTLAYQVPYSFRIDFGGDRAAARRYDDDPYLDDWNDPEPGDDTWLAATQPPFRWAGARSNVRLPGLGGGAWQADIRAAGQPEPGLTYSNWSDGTITSTVALSTTPRLYRHVFISTAGNLDLRFTTAPLVAPDDPRSLGFVAFHATFTPLGPARWPAQTQLGLLATTLGVAYGAARRLGASRRAALLGALLLALLGALLLAVWRLPLTVFTPLLLPLVCGCYLLALVLLRLPVAGRTNQWSLVVGLVVLAFALRMGGMLHPHFRSSDDGLNANNLLGLSMGQVYQTERLPEEVGGGEAPYPPGQYVVLAPLQLLFAPGLDGRLLALRLGNALLDSMGVGLIWYVLWRRVGSRAALLGAALYVVPPPVLKSFSVGEFANLFGQSMALVLAAALALAASRLRDRRVFLLVLALFGLALLGHSGVTISLALLLGPLTLLWLAAPATRRAARGLLLVGAVAVAGAGLVYYSAFASLMQAPPAEGAARPAEGPAPTFGEKLANEMNRVFGEQPARPLSLLGAAIGGLGVAALAPRRRGLGPRAPTLRPLLVAWWLGALLSLGALLVRGQTVRWDLFLYPAICLGAGPALDALWRRGRAGKLVVVTTLVFLLWRGLAYWVGLIVDYLHV